ncbi:unnamed protein product, partial [Prorocentrum cordatum]
MGCHGSKAPSGPAAPPLVFQLGACGWRCPEEPVSAPGVAHEAYHAAASGAEGCGGCYSVYPSAVHDVCAGQGGVRVARVGFALPSLPGAGPAGAPGWHSLSDDEVVELLKALEDAACEQLAAAEAERGRPCDFAIVHDVLWSPVVMQRANERRVSEGKPVTPVVAFCHGPDAVLLDLEAEGAEEHPARFGPLLESVGSWRTLAAVVAASEEAKRGFLRHFPFDSGRVLVAPPAYSSLVFRPRGEGPEALRDFPALAARAGGGLGAALGFVGRGSLRLQGRVEALRATAGELRGEGAAAARELRAEGALVARELREEGAAAARELREARDELRDDLPDVLQDGLEQLHLGARELRARASEGQGRLVGWLRGEAPRHLEALRERVPGPVRSGLGQLAGRLPEGAAAVVRAVRPAAQLEPIPAERYSHVVLVVGGVDEEALAAVLRGAQMYEASRPDICTVVVAPPRPAGGAGPRGEPAVTPRGPQPQHVYLVEPQGPPGLARLLSLADLGVFPGPAGSLPAGLLECLACGTPAACSSADGLPRGAIGAPGAGPLALLAGGESAGEPAARDALAASIHATVTSGLAPDARWKACQGSECLRLAERFSVAAQCPDIIQQAWQLSLQLPGLGPLGGGPAETMA